MRINKAKAVLERLKADAMLLLNESNMHYFCGFSPSEGAVLLLKNGSGFHLVDSRYTETAQLHAKESGLKVIEQQGGFADKCAELCRENDVKALAFEDETITLKQYDEYKAKTGCEMKGIGASVMMLRNIKEPLEIEYMRRANAIAERSLTELLQHIRPGKTEKELKALLDYLMIKNGADGISFDTILLTGAHSSMPHGVPDDREIRYGDIVLIDFGATYKGYHSDMTRTFAVGNIERETAKFYEAVLKAQQAGIKALAPGKPCSEVYAAAKGVLDAHGVGKYFTHSLGHGVGLEIHEGYNASPKSKDVYEAGNITSIEPGIYLPGKCGIRIEDVCVVTEEGNENISAFPKELMVI